MQPTARQVANTWREGVDDGLVWLESLGIQTGTATMTLLGDSCRMWHTARMPAWGTTEAGWSTYREQFAGVSWFIWRDETPQRVLGSAIDLAHFLSDALGPATESSEPTPLSGGTWWWQLEAHSIEMYAYTGAMSRDRRPAIPPCVQLAVDLREVSNPREAEAVRQSEAGGF